MSTFSNIFKTASVVLTALFCQSAFAQYDYYEQPVDTKTTDFSYKLYTGFNCSKIGFKEQKGVEDPDPHVRPSLDLGIRVDHYIYSNMTYYRSFGLRYSYGSYKVDFPEGNVKSTQHRFVVPFTIGLLGQIHNTYVGFGPNVHLGGAIGGTTEMKYDGKKDTYACNGDESSFIAGIGAELWFSHRHLFYGLSYNKSLEWYKMPREFGDFKSNTRGMLSFYVGFNF